MHARHCMRDKRALKRWRKGLLAVRRGSGDALLCWPSMQDHHHHHHQQHHQQPTSTARHHRKSHECVPDASACVSGLSITQPQESTDSGLYAFWVHWALEQPGFLHSQCMCVALCALSEHVPKHNTAVPPSQETLRRKPKAVRCVSGAVARQRGMGACAIRRCIQRPMWQALCHIHCRRCHNAPHRCCIRAPAHHKMCVWGGGDSCCSAVLPGACAHEVPSRCLEQN